MRILANQAGVAPPDADYPNGRIVDGQTVISEGVNGDLIQFFQRLVDIAGITENDLPDNETNGYQLIQALDEYLKGDITDVITLETGWNWVGPDGYCLKTKTGIVFMHGEIRGDSGASTHAFTLPAGMRPANSELKEFPVIGFDDNDDKIYRAHVEYNGNGFIMNPTGGSTNTFYLDAIIYKAGN